MNLFLYICRLPHIMYMYFKQMHDFIAVLVQQHPWSKQMLIHGIHTSSTAWQIEADKSC